ncbi:MAG: bifunctional precorrin-2 dehydrogenase/sirohydrochlorin ferrochelatase, partial [Pirellulaceae bacterium]
MEYFPIFLRLAGEPVLVVGGGDVAARKEDLLRRAGADITVVAPRVKQRLAAFLASRENSWVKGEFQPEHLSGMRLAIAATDRQSDNAWVAHQAEARGIDVNVVDDRELSRFIMPAIVDRS